MLLAASLLFYASLKTPYLLIVLTLVAMTTYSFGMLLGRPNTPGMRRALFWCGIAVNVAILAVMKYLPFLSENLKMLATIFSFDISVQPVKAFVAIGTSYYIFQAMSYLIDIYLEIEKPERHFGYFMLYLAFFPKLLQGPIERAGDLLPQLKNQYVFDYDNTRYGILLFTWGLLKKVVIADRLGLYVDSVYNNVHMATGLPLLVATCAYAFQIYMDFSGYTDMALGSARLFNIKLTQNFNRPYHAISIADFWRRWHISFSRWILDYIFRPLQMQWRDWKNWGTAAALMVTFLVSGIWHGASWGFVIWGLLHGTYLACSVFYRPFQKKLHKGLGLEGSRFIKIWQQLITFGLVSFAWIFFRANSLSDAQYVIANMFMFGRSTPVFNLSDYSNVFFLVAGIVFFILSIPLIADNGRRLFQSRWRWAFYYALFFVIFYLGTNTSKFIYFQF